MLGSRVPLISAVGFGSLYLGASAALGATPAPAASGAAVAAWFVGHDEHVRWWLWLLTLAVPFFAFFAACVRARLSPPYRDVFFAGAIAFIAQTAVQGWLWAGMAWHANQLSPASARTLLDVASFWGPALNGATMAMLIPLAAAGLRREPSFPRWVSAVCTVAAVEQLVETVTVFGRSGFFAPGGAMNVYLGAGLVGLSVLAVGGALSGLGQAPLASAVTGAARA